ncbi:MAG: DedA family protein [Rhizobiaceae bacterium]|nr:MAG: DedA family protein [Rhizobiaceae bacterium]CAG0949635.1 putative membrane protein [Rhizobiaceae bacterium]
MTETALLLLGAYGGPVLFVVLLLGSIGLPLPSTVLLLATGVVAATGDVDRWTMATWGICGAVLGDQIGYALGRLAGTGIEERLGRHPSLARNFGRAREIAARWGGAGVFFTRWLLSPIGPAVNIVAGVAAYPWPRFAPLSLAGEALWVGLFMGLGAAAGRGIEELAAIAGNVSWFLVAALAAAVLGWQLFRAR